MKSDRIPREHYLAKLRAAKDTDLIKVISGIRRCGKSTLMRMFMDNLVENGVSPEELLFIDFDRDSEDIPRDHASLSAYVESILSPGPGKYLFLDEVQNVDGWEASVASFYSQGFDVYVTGSNSQMLSSELATKLSGRCVEIHVAPLAFSEYMLFREGEDAERLFGDYIRDGGLPRVARMEDELAKDIIPETLEGVYNTVFVKDVAERHSVRAPAVLNSIVRFMMRNIGDRTSPRGISNYLTSQGIKVSHVTAEEYMSYIVDAYLMSRAERIDIKTKECLRTSDKFYAADLGVRNRMASFRLDDLDGILENVVYNELVYRYGKAAVCDVGGKEIDFIAGAGGSTMYFQVSLSILDKGTREREMAPLRAVQDNYPKTIIVYDRIPTIDADGIRIVNVVDWLLEGYSGRLEK